MALQSTNELCLYQLSTCKFHTQHIFLLRVLCNQALQTFRFLNNFCFQQQLKRSQIMLLLYRFGAGLIPESKSRSLLAYSEFNQFSSSSQVLLCPAWYWQCQFTYIIERSSLGQKASEELCHSAETSDYLSWQQLKVGRDLYFLGPVEARESPLKESIQSWANNPCINFFLQTHTEAAKAQEP